MDQVQSSRPKIVGIAVTILYVTLGVSCLNIFMQVLLEPNPILRKHWLSNIWINLLDIGIFLLIVYKISKGRNWARITFLVFFIVGSILEAPQLFQNLLQISFTGLISIVISVIEIIALVMLFQKPSSDWFILMKGIK